MERPGACRRTQRLPGARVQPGDIPITAGQKDKDAGPFLASANKKGSIFITYNPRTTAPLAQYVVPVVVPAELIDDPVVPRAGAPAGLVAEGAPTSEDDCAPDVFLHPPTGGETHLPAVEPPVAP